MKPSQFIKIAIYSFSLLMLGACLSKKNSDADLFKGPGIEYKDYVSAFTGGIVSRATPIRIQFANDIASDEQIGKELPENPFRFSPAIEGKAIWENSSTLRFEPKDWLPSNKRYNVSIDIGAYFKKIPSKLKRVEFAFRTIQQSIELEVHALREQEAGDLKHFKLKGVLFCSDVATIEEVQAAVKAKYKGQDMGLVWTHNNGQKQHDFELNKIPRSTTNKDELLFLSWNGDKMGSNKKGVDTVHIPGDVFKVLAVRTLQEGEDNSYISIQFSKPIAQWLDTSAIQSGPLVNFLNENENDYYYEDGEYYYGESGFNIVVDGNELKCYPQNQPSGDYSLEVDASIKSIDGQLLSGESTFTVSLEKSKPKVRLLGDGVIIPNTQGLNFPFEAIYLKAVDVEIFKIYENNVLHFLQGNSFNNTDNMNYGGHIIYQKRVHLQSINPNAKLNKWTRYALNLDEIVKEEKGAIYQVRIGFRKNYAHIPCTASANADELLKVEPQFKVDEETGEYNSLFERRDYWDYDYSNRNNPCYDDYYSSNRFIQRNVLGSNLGIIAKRGKNKEMLIVVTDLLTAKPVQNAQIELYDRANQRIGKTATGQDGTARIATERAPALLLAKSGDQKGYLKVQDGQSLSLSRFEIGGSNPGAYKGMKAKLYGERGVWRPGDSLFLTLVVENKLEELPLNYPVSLKLFNPLGQLVQQRSIGEHIRGVYSFKIATSADAPTGNWEAKVEVGGLTINERIKIETIKPNRLKIKLDLATKELKSHHKNLSVPLQLNWLHGAVAKNLACKVDVQLNPVSTVFEAYKDFVFDDPTRRNDYSEPFTLFEGQVDDQGKAMVNGQLHLAELPAGKMRAAFTVRAFEAGGDFSIDNFTMPFSPFGSYVGIAIPKDKYGSKQIKVKEASALKIVAVDETGNPIANRKVKVSLVKLDWRWWWDNDYESLSKYNTSLIMNAIETKELQTDAKGLAIWSVTPPEWGRYLVKVNDLISGHSTGDFFYAGSPWDNGDYVSKSESAMLVFASNKESYQTGDEVILSIPTGKAGRALVTLENNQKVIKHYWVDINDTSSAVKEFKFKTDASMSPTVYAQVSLIQPYVNSENDLPIRSYGVIPIKVEDPNTKLEPVLDMPKVLQPNSKAKLLVKETKGKAMTYTIAIVDEGLLDLTRFQTPDLWAHFYMKEALGVHTWDIYDQVLGKFGVQLDRIIAVGGDAVLGAAETKKANRFKPMVRYLGPYRLEAGKQASHEVDIPNYIGSVRTMLVASNNGAYGSTEQTTPVRKALMTLATLPRVLSPNEELSLPVSVFAMESKIKSVKLELEHNDLVSLSSERQQQMTFNEVGDQMAYFKLKVAEKLGVAKIKIKASSGGETASYELEVQVRNPNPIITKVQDAVVEPGKDWAYTLQSIGMKGSNKASLELSNLPPINLAKRLHYLIHYPYGCIEQTVSTAFPQLFVSNLTKLSPAQQTEIEVNIKEAINRIAKFQTPTGGLGYWPGAVEASEWGTTYGGHFLVEAAAKGYVVSKELMDPLMDYQKKMAALWKAPPQNSAISQESAALMQAYRLYVLALAKKPELGAMNNLLSNKSLPLAAKWRLAAAYALVGKADVAERIVTGLATEVQPYKELSFTFGSEQRDEAMILETLTLMKRKEQAALVLRRLSDKLSSEEWMSTQTTAYALMAIAKFVGDRPGTQKATYTYSLDGTNSSGELEKLPIFRLPIDMESQSKRSLSLKNTGQTMLFARVLLEGQPAQGDLTELSNSLKIEVSYLDLEGKAVNPSRLAQGTDFIAIVKVSNPGLRGDYQEMALSQVFPSGWEIINSRMNVAFSEEGNSTASYRDIRDDRVNTFFNIKAAEIKTYKVYLNAAYQGKFYMPNIACEAMYDHSIYANKAGQWVEVAGS